MQADGESPSGPVARRRQRSAEDRERRSRRRAEDQLRREERRALDLEVRRQRRVEDSDIRTERKTGDAARKQRLAAEKRRRRQARKDAKVEQRKRRAAEIAAARAADAEARDLLKQSRAEARRAHQLRKAEDRERRRERRIEDSELRRRRRTEDAERRRTVAADGRVQIRRKRRWTRWFGLGLVLVGISLAGWLGWQLWGTNWVSQRKHERIVEEVREDWTVASGTTITVVEPPVVDVREGEVSALIRIPEFGDDYVVPVLEGTSEKVLAAGFGHFSHSADPGEVGNYALAAHRVTHGEPLREMPSLDIGDEVIVETQYATYTYVLTSGGDDLRVDFTDIWVVDALPTNPDRGGVQPAQSPGQRLITLTTCAELFHTDDRLIAFGVLEDIVVNR